MTNANSPHPNDKWFALQQELTQCIVNLKELGCNDNLINRARGLIQMTLQHSHELELSEQETRDWFDERYMALIESHTREINNQIAFLERCLAKEREAI